MTSSLYTGEVVHQRLRPKPHRLRYRVFSLLLDADEIDEIAGRCRLFSRNRFNALSFHDRDHGSGDGEPVASSARRIFSEAGLTGATHRVLLLAYPRVFGYVFNPLSVTYGFDPQGRLSGLIYQVDNTVGERKCYVLAAGEPQGRVYAHGCAKEMYVSPFTPAHGTYGFRVTAPGETVLLGVHLRDEAGALLRTHFHGQASGLDDRSILRALAAHPLMTMKVMGAIHFEALRLFGKGVPVVRRHRSPRYSITVVPIPSQGR